MILFGDVPNPQWTLHEFHGLLPSGLGGRKIQVRVIHSIVHIKLWYPARPNYLPLDLNEVVEIIMTFGPLRSSPRI